MQIFFLKSELYSKKFSAKKYDFWQGGWGGGWPFSDLFYQGGGAVGQLLILADKGVKGGLQAPIFG